MYRVENKRINWINDVSIAIGSRLPVALEGVFASLRLGCVFEPFDGNATLNTAGGVPSVIGHTRDGAGEISQRRLALLPGLQVTTSGGYKISHRVQVINIDDAACHGNHHLAGADRERMRLPGESHPDGGAGRVSNVMNVEGAVPCGRHKNTFCLSSEPMFIKIAQLS